MIKRFIVFGPVVAKQRPKFSRAGGFVRSYTPDKTVNYENLVKMSYYQEHGNFMFDKDIPLKVIINIEKSIPKSFSNRKRELAINGFIRPLTRPDCDNVAKSITDALNGIAYHDDAQITDLEVYKRFGHQDLAEVSIQALNQN